jgi:FG-GAP-like repeat
MKRSLLIASVVATLATTSAPQSAWAGDGGFKAGQDLPVPDPSALAVGDFNNDGRPDLAVASTSLESVQVVLSQRGGFTPSPAVPVGRKPDTIAVGDFNLDGNDDLAVGNTLGGSVSIRLGYGDGSFRNAGEIAVGAVVHSVVVGDFNGDAIDDLAIPASGPAGSPDRIQIALGVGNGTFTTDHVTPAGAVVLAVGDFNSDAIEDLAFGGNEDNRPGSLLLGAGGGEFRAPTDIPLQQQAGFRRGWAVGDFNGDARTDMLASLSNDVVSVRLNRGNGSFSAAPDVPAGDHPHGGGGRRLQLRRQRGLRRDGCDRGASCGAVGGRGGQLHGGAGRAGPRAPARRRRR